jgi:uncharacterized protein DUF2585
VSNLVTERRSIWPWLVLATVLIGATFQLRSQGRSWWCSCGQLFVWAGDVWSSHNSQHPLDPYSFTHLLHGFVIWWLLALCIPRVAPAWRIALATALEALWEVIENTEFVIQRYRETTAALGYEGDSIANSLGDIIVCGLGLFVAWRLGFRRSLLFFLAIEVVLIIWIRDSLILEVLMLIYPIDAIKSWQMGH